MEESRAPSVGQLVRAYDAGVMHEWIGIVVGVGETITLTVRNPQYRKVADADELVDVELALDAPWKALKGWPDTCAPFDAGVSVSVATPAATEPPPPPAIETGAPPAPPVYPASSVDPANDEKPTTGGRQVGGKGKGSN